MEMYFPKQYYLMIAAPFVCIYLISTLCFTRISMKHIEKKMREEGLEQPKWDRGWGLTVGMYSSVIRRQKPAKATVVNDEAILRHTRPIDLYLARTMDYSFYIMMTLATYGYFAYDPEL